MDNKKIDDVIAKAVKKVGGKKLYKLARKGIEIERKSVLVTVNITLLSYEYPHLRVQVSCSKGTYIRAIAHDIGKALGCYAHLTELTRTRSGCFSLCTCFDGSLLYQDIEKHHIESCLIHE